MTSRIECKWGRTMDFSRLHSIWLKSSTASELGLRLRSFRENVRLRPCRIDWLIVKSIRQGRGLRFSHEDRTYGFLLWFFCFLQTCNGLACEQASCSRSTEMPNFLCSSICCAGITGESWLPHKETIRVQVLSATRRSHNIIRFIIISLVFLHLSKLLFSGFL